MKLRLVREDGTDATIRDLMTFDRAVIEIDGVKMLLQQIENYGLDSDCAHLAMTLAYGQEHAGIRTDHRGYVRPVYRSPFLSTKARRPTETRALPVDERRRRERTEYRP